MKMKEILEILNRQDEEIDNLMPKYYKRLRKLAEKAENDSR